MSKCNEHWCENYGKNNSKCDSCEKKTVEQENPNLRDILKRRAVKQMELDNPQNKGQTPSR